MTSPVDEAASNAFSNRAGSSPTIPRSTTSTPSDRRRARISVVLESRIWPRSSCGVSRSTNSSPVAIMATTGRLRTSGETPREASTPAWVGPILSPAPNTSVPASRSPPAGRTFSPAATPCMMRTAVAPTGSVTSTRTTASAPSGSGAPVMILIAVPAVTAASAAEPAAASSSTSSSTGTAATDWAWTAYPSIAELANAGTSSGAVTSSTSARPSASAGSTRCSGSSGTRSRISA